MVEPIIPVCVGGLQELNPGPLHLATSPALFYIFILRQGKTAKSTGQNQPMEGWRNQTNLQWLHILVELKF